MTMASHSTVCRALGDGFARWEGRAAAVKMDWRTRHRSLCLVDPRFGGHPLHERFRRAVFGVPVPVGAL